MKKILGIVLLTLLLSVNTYANTFYLYCDREIYENNGSGDWSQYYKVGNSPDGSILIKTEDWKFEERLSKEFESVGFFISDHPLNQFTEIFNDYKITDYLSFISKEDLKDSNIAATLLKVQERKTAKGNSYAVLKLTDLSSVFELFIFSDVLELNREILKEGSSLILTIFKNVEIYPRIKTNSENYLKNKLINEDVNFTKYSEIKRNNLLLPSEVSQKLFSFEISENDIFSVTLNSGDAYVIKLDKINENKGVVSSEDIDQGKNYLTTVYQDIIRESFINELRKSSSIN